VEVGGVKNSSHLRGWAADIICRGSSARFLITKALMAAGFNRLEFDDLHIHVDADPSLSANVFDLRPISSGVKPS
jgi:hypothetical protein